MPNMRDAVACTNNILLKVREIWVGPVFGQSLKDFKDKDFVAACNIVENFKPKVLKAGIF